MQRCHCVHVHVLCVHECTCVYNLVCDYYAYTYLYTYFDYQWFATTTAKGEGVLVVCLCCVTVVYSPFSLAVPFTFCHDVPSCNQSNAGVMDITHM